MLLRKISQYLSDIMADISIFVLLFDLFFVPLHQFLVVCINE